MDREPVVVTIDNGIIVTIQEDAKAVKKIYTDLKNSRRIKNPDAITMTHRDVIKLADADGIKITKSISTDDAEKVYEIIEQLKSHHVDMAKNAQRDAFSIQRLADIFDNDYTDTVRYRSDIATLAKSCMKDVQRHIDEWFESDVIGRYAFTPEYMNPNRPVEQRAAYGYAFVSVICPDIYNLYDKALRGDNGDVPMIVSEVDEDVDEEGFQSE